MNNSLDAVDSGSNYSFGDKLVRPNFPRSAFDLSHVNCMSFPVACFGSLIPVLTMPTVPGDSFDISVDCLLRVLPQVVPLYSRQRLYVHAFYCRGADLWNSWNVFASKGYNGKRNLTIPTLDTSNCAAGGGIGNSSLLHYLYGVPVGTSFSAISGKLSALPAMMYFKIWRDYFMNKNFYLENSYLLPDDDSDFRLGNNGKILSYDNNVSGLIYMLDTWRYRDFANDRFTTCFPSPQRGEAPTLDINFNDPDYTLNVVLRNLGGSVATPYLSSLESGFSIGMLGAPTRDDYYALSYDGSSGNNVVGLKNGRPTTGTYNFYAKFPQDMPLTSSITLNDLRVLAINQTELEKMAHTDGSYREFGLTFFGVSSKTAVDYRPLYIGGTYQPIVYTEVVQTTPTEDSPLGTYGGHGISSKKGYIGHIDCDDYGYIMLVASVMPDTYYSQGISKAFTDLSQSDLFLPERAKLGMVPVLNKELYFTGNVSDDDDLFAYQDIFDDLRYLPNVVHGKLADKNALDFFPYTQSRNFQSKPTFSQSFATTQGNVRRDYLSAPNEVPFTAQFGFSIRAVRPLPYRAQPASFI